MAANRIVLIERGKNPHEEIVAIGVFKPGHLLKKDTAGKVLVHATAGRQAERMFAKEDSLQGKTITGAYAVGDVAMVHMGNPGDVIYARLPASALAIVIDDNLVSNGDGCLKKTTATTEVMLAKAMEAIDNSAGGAEVFIKVRLL